MVSLAKLGHFPVDLVERVLLDKGKDMPLILARAADCSWTTTRELLQMQAAGRNLTPDNLSPAFNRYKKLGQENGAEHHQIPRAAHEDAGGGNDTGRQGPRAPGWQGGAPDSGGVAAASA